VKRAPELVFSNILAGRIEFPDGQESLSEAAMDAVNALLTLNPEKRIKMDGLKGLTLFEGEPCFDICYQQNIFLFVSVHYFTFV
jgi:hypothetical protein